MKRNTKMLMLFMCKHEPVISILGHKVLDLSISLISLFSFILYFLFPHIAFASTIVKNKALAFDFTNSIKKPYSISDANIKTGNDAIVIAKSGEEKAKILPIEVKTISYGVSAAIVNYHTEPKKTGTANNQAYKVKAMDVEGKDFAEYISKDKYVNPEEEAMLVAGQGKVVSKRWVTVTAYSSTPDQTDSSPFITASGTHVHDGIVATNALPFGTKIRIPAIYDNKIFTVEDRMNARYKDNVDIWFTTRQSAKNFGVKKAEIEVVKLP